MANLIQYYPPNRSTDDPGASLADNPCVAPKCMSEHELMAMLVFLMAAYTSAGTPAQLETATKKFRGISKVQGLAFMNTAFSDQLVETATAANLKCLECYSDQQLFQMFLYLWKLLLQVP